MVTHSARPTTCRHGPGDNAFNHLIDPFGIVIGCTAEVGQIDDGHRAVLFSSNL